jgi:hypothetical protein
LAVIFALASARAMGSSPRGGIAFLTGLWITATHVPLIPDAVDGIAPWGTALLHLSAGPPILVLGVWMLLRPQDSASAPGARPDR